MKAQGKRGGFRRAGTIQVLTIAAIAASCSPHSEQAAEQDPKVGGAAVPLSVPADWVGYDLGLLPPSHVRTGQSAPPAPIAPGERLDPLVVEGPDQAPDDDGSLADALLGMGRDGEIFEFIAPYRDLEAIGELLRATGEDGASELRPEPLRDKGWSSGVDERAYWPNAPGHADWPRDTIGVLSPTDYAWCTGTLFHDRLVLTAAHCLWDGNGNWLDLKFRAGQDGNTRPYGEVAHVWKYYPRKFLEADCHRWRQTGFRSVCTKWDWAVVVLAHAPTDADGISAGYMGYMYSFNDAKIGDWFKYNSGYAACNNAGANAQCAELGGDNILFDNLAPCETGKFSNPHHGLNHNLDAGCDTSGGHSGGSLYSWSPGSVGPYITGIYSAETCAGTECSSATPNRFLRLYPTLGQLLSYYRALFR